MRKIFTLLFILSVVITSAQTVKDTSVTPDGPQELPKADPPPSGEKTNILEPLLAYNFSGGNKKLTNFTPVINYGWTRAMAGIWSLSINPYAAGQIDVKDSSNVLPGLMLPGIAGLQINNFLTFNAGGGKIVLFPVNLGLKLMTGFLDSSQVLMQTNIRSGIGYSLPDFFQVGIQYTHGSHGITSESEELFKKIFKRDKTTINYLTVVLEAYTNKESSQPSLLYLEWRKLLNTNDFKGYPNSKIITIGFRKTFDLNNLTPSAKAAAHPNIN